MTAGILFVEKVLQKIFFKHLVTEIQEKNNLETCYLSFL